MKKQYVPFPEYLTALSDVDRGEPEHAIFDIVANGGCPFFVFDEGHDDPTFWYTDNLGSIGDDKIVCVPTMHCKDCGQRMFVEDIPLEDPNEFTWYIPDEKITYRCTCGTTYNRKTGWNVKRGEEE